MIELTAEEKNVIWFSIEDRIQEMNRKPLDDWQLACIERARALQKKIMEA